MTTSQQDLKTDPYRLAICAAERLRAAMAGHDIVIPSLRGDHPVMGAPMVTLGGCRADVADALAAVLEKIQPEGCS
ncbi:hypothetical protein [Streptacidiphilus sp. EB103A]|uniref:hypothetical protein n=1 Tax=Streptacidiphilus sp. EB103A TaxID=3156275 RepID=UPI00351992FD